MATPSQVRKAKKLVRKESPKKFANITVIKDRRSVGRKPSMFKKVTVDEKSRKCRVNLPYRWIKHLQWETGDTIFIRLANDLNGITIWNMDKTSPRKQMKRSTVVVTKKELVELHRKDAEKAKKAANKKNKQKF